MLTIKLDGLQQTREAVAEFSARRFRNAVSTALTRSAKEMSLDWQEQIGRRLDRPNPRTQAATTFLSSNSETLRSEVKVKDQLSGTPPSEYLGPQQRSGGRGVKKFEQALQASGAMPRGYITVPGRGAQLDGYGNVSRSQIIAVIAALGAEYSPGYQRVIPKTVAGRLRVMAKKGVSYTAIRPDDAAAKEISPGIYEAKALGDTTRPGWWRGALKAVFLYKRATRYRKRLDLQEHAIKEGPKVIATEFDRAVAESFARLKAAGG